MKILSELGPDLSHFASVKHFCSWLGLCPDTKISGGKMLSAKTKRSANRVRQALKMAAMSLSHSSSALGAFYRSHVHAGALFPAGRQAGFCFELRVQPDAVAAHRRHVAAQSHLANQPGRVPGGAAG